MSKHIKYSICKHCRKIFKQEYYNHGFCSDFCKEQFALIKAENLKCVDKAKYLIYERDDFRCCYCGKSSIEDSKQLCIDHIEPYSIHMNSNIYNLITACYDCNMGKGPRELKRDTYIRIVNANIKRTNDKMSEDSEAFVNTVMKMYFDNQKKNTNPNFNR